MELTNFKGFLLSLLSFSLHESLQILKGQPAYLKEGNNVQDKSPAITSGEKPLP